MVKSSGEKPRSDKNSEAKNKTNSRMTVSPVVRFVVLFLVLIVVVSVLFSQVFTRYHDQMLWLMEITATIAGGTLSVFTDHVEYSGVHVYYHGFSVEIIDECTGLFEMLLYIAAVLSFSTTWRKKLIGLLMGIPAIFLFNLIRITVLLVVGANSFQAFKFMHIYFWQVTLIIMIATIWITWLYLVVYREKRVLAVSG
jgi:archaeosortase B (VPXXXP-CTERM-specific)